MSQLQFHDLAVSREMQRAIGDLGYVSATEIQAQAIPAIMEGKDLIGQAQTGTGKTAAFGIPLVEGIERGNRDTQSIVLCPTRELAVQVCDELRKLARYRRDIRIIPIFGGVSIEKQRMELRRGAHIVVGTPGRFIDQIERGSINLDTVKTVVLDEADEMLNMGFRPYIEQIMGMMPEQKQTVLFSATMSKDIREIAARYLQNPTTVTIAKKELTADNIHQVYYETLGVNKVALIQSILEKENPDSIMVFCNTKSRVDIVVKKMLQAGYTSAGIHGDFVQNKRMRTMNEFRRGELRVLVATDVAARGLDISSVSMVINYDLPLDPEYYVHRIGRTGRAGKSGKAITFSHGREELHRLRSIEKFAKTTLEKALLPEDIFVDIYEPEPQPLRRGKKSSSSNNGRFSSSRNDDGASRRSSYGNRDERSSSTERSSGGGFERRDRDERRSSGGGFERRDRDDRRSSGGGFERRDRDERRSSGGGFERRDRDDRRSSSGGGFERRDRDERRSSSGGGFERSEEKKHKFDTQPQHDSKFGVFKQFKKRRTPSF
jgi:ATP-dependent RNA helicase DeaD